MEKLNKKIDASFGYKFLITILFVIIFWLPRSGDLDVFMATDEGVWLYRAADFYYALGQREFEHTYTTNHPGVVTSWIGTIGLLVEFPEYRGLGQGYFGEYYAYEDFMQAKGIQMIRILATSRLLTVIFLTMLLAVCFYISLDLFGFKLASIAFVLLAFDPLFLATSRTYHLDAPMASLVLLSLLPLLLYYKKDAKSILLLLLSGASAGGAVLAKLTGAIYAVSALVFIMVYPLLFDPGEHKTFQQRLLETLPKLFMWGAAAGAAMFVFWPALWVQPVNSFLSLFSYAVGTSSGAVQTASVYVEPTTFFFYNPFQPTFMNYIASFMWRTTPVVLLGLIFAAIAFVLRIAPWQNRKFKAIIFGLLLFSVFYTLVMGISAKQSEKYYLPVILMLDLIAGFGLASLSELAGRVSKRASSYPELIAGGVVALLLSVHLLLVLPTHPYFFTYYNPLLGGPQAASEKIFVGSGEGLNLVADYLNQKPDPQDLDVLAWYGTGCLSYFFEGQVEIISLDDTWSNDEQTDLQNSDYLVTYTNQWFRYRPEVLLDQLQDIKPEHIVRLNGIEYVRIYDTDQLPGELFGE